MSEVVLKQSEASERSEGYVVVRGGALGFAQEIQVGRHRLQADGHLRLAERTSGQRV